MATHIAGWLAKQGCAVMLGDVDRQQSTQSWLRARSPALPPIASWIMDTKNVLRVPAGISHVVLDTPGGLNGFELARTVMLADAILMPVCDSIFDRNSAAACHAELQQLPRISSGRCKVGAIGMRLDSRTRSSAAMQEWASAHQIGYIGSLRDTQNYVRTVERGMTVFDLSPGMGGIDQQQWQPILDWLRPILWPSANQDTMAPRASAWGASSVLQRAAQQRTPLQANAHRPVEPGPVSRVAPAIGPAEHTKPPPPAAQAPAYLRKVV
ncbi:MAG: ParA family protein [Pseudomonadota bacterium]|nr:ParA family protein [Pseudomonadota bacterium]